VIRAVIDTNVLVSGLLSLAGNEALIILALHQGLVRARISEEIIDEYFAVLARPKFAFPPDEIHPSHAADQIQGGAAQGIGSAICAAPLSGAGVGTGQTPRPLHLS